MSKAPIRSILTTEVMPERPRGIRKALLSCGHTAIIRVDSYPLKPQRCVDCRRERKAKSQDRCATGCTAPVTRVVEGEPLCERCFQRMTH